MQASHENSEDVRTRLGVMSVKWKRIRHVFRMWNGRLTKAVVLEWWEEIE